MKRLGQGLRDPSSPPQSEKDIIIPASDQDAANQQAESKTPVATAPCLQRSKYPSGKRLRIKVPEGAENETSSCEMRTAARKSFQRIVDKILARNSSSQESLGPPRVSYRSYHRRRLRKKPVSFVSEKNPSISGVHVLQSNTGGAYINGGSGIFYRRPTIRSHCRCSQTATSGGPIGPIPSIIVTPAESSTNPTIEFTPSVAQVPEIERSIHNEDDDFETKLSGLLARFVDDLVIRHQMQVDICKLVAER